MPFQQYKPTLSLMPTLVGFAVVSTIYIFFCAANDIFDMAGDASGYLLAAQYFSPFQPSTQMLQAYSSEIIYPPLFSLIVGALGGEVGDNLCGGLTVFGKQHGVSVRGRAVPCADVPTPG